MFIGLSLGLLLNFLIIDTFEITELSSKVWCTILCAIFSAIVSSPKVSEEKD